jgi:hypothetical protein
MLSTFVPAIMALLLAAVSAGPVVQSKLVARNDSTPGIQYLPGADHKSINDCDDSSFKGLTDEKSPWIHDCLQIAANIARGGTWEIETITGKFHQLVQFGTCAFGVHFRSVTAYIFVGNQDITDLINDSIKYFGRNDLSPLQGLRSASRQETGMLWTGLSSRTGRKQGSK